MNATSSKPSYVLVLCAFAFIVVGVLVVLLQMNGGRFVYSLDDPYIHLALARHLAQGHYGINATEPSAPSSSILWPFLLAPFASFSAGEYAPFIICLLASAGAIVLVLRRFGGRYNSWLLAAGLVALTNQVGLIFTGMEHSLQVLLAVTVAVGLLDLHETGQVSKWLMVAMIVDPLVRYEGLAITLPAAGYLWFTGHRRTAVMCVVTPVVCLALFSGFLKSLGLGLLPSSVVAKSGAGTSTSPLKDLLSNCKRNLLFKDTLIQVYSFLVLLAVVGYAAAKTKGADRLLALTALAAGVLHMFVGRFGWAGRYEPYILAFVGLLLLGLWPKISFGKPADSPKLSKAAAWGLLIVMLPAGYFSVVKNAMVAPSDSHGIYLQQYQMHRFVLEDWKRPIAVNDLGWVSWENDQYVLDLWGLGNYEALKLRTSQADPEWMEKLCAEHQVKAVMFYDDWFTRAPVEWQKVGTLTRNGGVKPHDNVAIYATDPAAVGDLRQELAGFSATLPQGATLTLLPAR